MPSGVYVISSFCNDDRYTAEAYCDTITNGGGWLVVQRRQDGSVSFDRTWAEYEDGFGKLTGEFWYGLTALHCLTSQGDWEMRMDIKYRDGSRNFLQYRQFKVASPQDKYRLTVGGFRGTITSDPMNWHNGMNFTTVDQDNDMESGGNCALLYGPDKPAGGWWHNQCWNVNPNNFYSNLGNVLSRSNFIEMKIRPLYCNI